MTSYRINDELNGIEITFTEKPAEAIREELKESGFRWGRGYWWAKQTPERIALAERLADEWRDTEGATTAPQGMKWQNNGKPRFSGERKARLVQKADEQNRIKIYYNGFRLDGDKKLSVSVWYYIDGEDVRISARNYERLPRDLFEVHNDTDIYTDYFDNDGATVTPSHPLYKYIYYAALKAKASEARKHLEYLGNRATEAERAGCMRKIEAFQNAADPGQPTAADLAEIDKQKQEAENARIEAEHRAELEERERVLSERVAGRDYIEKVSEAYPIEDGAPVVNIPFSENPAFYSYMMDDREKITINADGTTTREIIERAPRCVLSVAAADIVLDHFDKLHDGIGYDKTDFVITWTDESGESWEYKGRYDIGDKDGGLVEHISALAEWDKEHGQQIDEGRAAWVELLQQYRAA